MCNSIHTCAVTIRIVVCFTILAFAFKFDFPTFVVLVIALSNDGTIMTLSVDHILPFMEPDSWNLAEIFAYAVAYGLYPTLSAIALVAVAIKTDWFYRVLGVHFQNGATTVAGNNVWFVSGSVLVCSYVCPYPYSVVPSPSTSHSTRTTSPSFAVPPAVSASGKQS